MAIIKQFLAHTELKAQDLNELVSQANAADAAEKARAEADLAAEVLARDTAIATEQARAEAEEAKKPNKVELYGRDNSEPLPMDATYYYKGLPTHSVQGQAFDSVNTAYTDYVAICIKHEPDDGYEPQHHTVQVFVKTGDDYLYSKTFNTSGVSDYLELHIARALGSANATISYSGLMSPEDKQDMNALLTEVFPLVVAIASSNAGTYEVGTYEQGEYIGAITPEVQLNITRRGSDVAASAVVTASSGTVAQDKKSVTDSPVYSGTKTVNVTVVQGGQTQLVSATWKFMNYVYSGEVASKPANSAAVKTLIETTWGSDTSKRTLSTATTKGSTALAANKYYVFACKGSVSLVVRHAETNGVISGCTTGTVTLNRVNQSGTDSYSYVIVDKSASAWNFKITNS